MKTEIITIEPREIFDILLETKKIPVGSKFMGSMIADNGKLEIVYCDE